MKICSWNINSIRARKELIFKWLEEKRKWDIDVLCFQELKVEEKDFPFEEFKQKGFSCEVSEQKRLIKADIKGITVINVYAPHGDLRGNDKYYYKLDWYDYFIKWLDKNFKPTDPIVLVGDFNVALEDIDVYDPQLLKDSIGTMPEERQALKKIIDWGFIDVFRYMHPDKKQFTWWDYIGGAIWKDEGMRIDYIFCTKPLLKKLKNVEVDLWPRRRRTPKPSDHAPVIAEFEV